LCCSYGIKVKDEVEGDEVKVEDEVEEDEVEEDEVEEDGVKAEDEVEEEEIKVEDEDEVEDEDKVKEDEVKVEDEEEGRQKVSSSEEDCDCVGKTIWLRGWGGFILFRTTVPSLSPCLWLISESQKITLVTPSIKDIGEVKGLGDMLAAQNNLEPCEVLESRTGRSKSDSGSASGPGSDLRYITRCSGAAGGSMMLGCVRRGVKLQLAVAAPQLFCSQPATLRPIAF
jgi:hypothetical protein